MQCKQECLWTAARCQVQVLCYSAVKYSHPPKLCRSWFRYRVQ